ncbi:MAG TPA: fibronectin type III domain-containing protein [Flavobacteriales bacterium]|nr:fibronectin type III domain-containing protein [Flavobacteriales bacterium]
MAEIKRGTGRLTSNQLAAKADFIVERMSDNPAFPDAAPFVTAVATASAALRDAIRDALDGGKTATAIKNSRHRDLKRGLDRLAGHVSSVAGGNELAILSSGFGVRKPSSPQPEPAMPTNLRASISDHTGRVDLSWDPVVPAVTYHTEWTAGDPTDEQAWELVSVSTRSSVKVSGLPSGKVSYFRVAGIGTKGMGPWSQVVSTLVK